jgi:hypothetical protein
MDERDDWAVVFVHGIGGQVPGETLGRFGSPLAEYALAQHGPGSRLERDEGGWVIHIVDGTRVRRWRMVEVHWADLVTAPTYRQLLRWLVLVAPWILHADALLWSQRRPRTPRRASIRWWLSIGLSLWSIRLLWAFMRGMMLLVAGALAQLVLTIVGLIGLVPALRGPALGLQRRLVGSVGDSFAYLYDAATWARIEQRLVDTVIVSAQTRRSCGRGDPLARNRGHASGLGGRIDAGRRDGVDVTRFGPAEVGDAATAHDEGTGRMGRAAGGGARHLLRDDPVLGVCAEPGHR